MSFKDLPENFHLLTFMSFIIHSTMSGTNQFNYVKSFRLISRIISMQTLNGLCMSFVNIQIVQIAILQCNPTLQQYLIVYADMRYGQTARTRVMDKNDPKYHYYHFLNVCF